MQNVPGEADIEVADQRGPQHLSFLSRAVVHNVGSSVRLQIICYGPRFRLAAEELRRTAAEPYAELVRRACDPVATRDWPFRESESTHTDRRGARGHARFPDAERLRETASGVRDMQERDHRGHAVGALVRCLLTETVVTVSAILAGLGVPECSGRP